MILHSIQHIGFRQLPSFQLGRVVRQKVSGCLVKGDNGGFHQLGFAFRFLVDRVDSVEGGV
jgi:hypothetical protein